MLNIKVLGPGCANCRKLEEIVHEAVAATGVQAEVSRSPTWARSSPTTC